MKFGLQGIRRILAVLDEPQNKFPSIHIAGTNGKGSTAAMAASILTAAGYRTGLYTSPHLLNFNERIRIDGRPIPARTVARLTSRIQPVVEQWHCTFFEAVTAIAFKYFVDEQVDIAVIETGLGGRLDATNTVIPLVSVITTIGLEHTHILGTTLRKIAREKGGIIKPGVPCITGVRSREALIVLKTIARRKHAPFLRTKKNSVICRLSNLKESILDIRTQHRHWKGLHLSLAGNFQFQNVSLALQAVDIAARRGSMKIPESAVRAGLSRVQHFTGLFGRCSVLQKDPFMIADVAHNPDAIKNLVDSLQRLGYSRVNLVFGAMKDKDVPAMAKALAPIIDTVLAVSPKTERAMPAEEIERIFTNLGISVRRARSVASGISFIKRKRRFEHPIVVTGSHFVVGEALAFFQGKKYLTINQ
ncbi:MAG: folylpolyglutamate synthase/dihydrofolate synthase family protein [Bacteroidota bacterium]